jgi:polyvinyl alcohol dehydrogenase (cytochrome)
VIVVASPTSSSRVLPMFSRYWLMVSLLVCGVVSSAFGCNDDDAKPARDAGAKGNADAGNTAKTPASWTMMGYDANNNYHQPNETELRVDNVSDLKEQWRHKVDGFPAGSPVIVDGKVFITATGGMVAVDLDTGHELWTQPMVAGTASPAYKDGFLYVHASTRANLYKLDANDGSIVWGPIQTYDNSAADGTSSPVIAGDKVLVGHSTYGEVGTDARTTAHGGVEAFDIEDGSRLWSYLTCEGDETGAMVWSTVAVDLATKTVFATSGNNYVAAGAGSDAFHAIDLETGERKWVTQVRQGDAWTIYNDNASDPLADTDFGANPILAQSEGRDIVAAGDKGSAFWAVSRDTGEMLWSHTDLSANHTPNNGGVLNNGAYDGTYFYVVANEPPDHSFLHVLDPKDGSDVRDPIRFEGIAWGAPSIANGVLYVPVNDVLKVLNAATGEELNSFMTGGTIAGGAPAIVDGRVVVKSGLQYMFAADAKNNNEFIAYGVREPPAPEAMADAGAPSDMPTFTSVYKNVIVAKGCNGASLCHGGEGGNLLMKDQESSYQALVNVDAMGVSVPSTGHDCKDSGLKRVVPEKPDDSLLLQKLLGTQPCGTEMPPGGQVDDPSIALVRAWIEQGAQDD